MKKVLLSLIALMLSITLMAEDVKVGPGQTKNISGIFNGTILVDGGTLELYRFSGSLPEGAAPDTPILKVINGGKVIVESIGGFGGPVVLDNRSTFHIKSNNHAPKWMGEDAITNTSDYVVMGGPVKVMNGSRFIIKPDDPDGMNKRGTICYVIIANNMEVEGNSLFYTENCHVTMNKILDVKSKSTFHVGDATRAHIRSYQTNGRTSTIEDSRYLIESSLVNETSLTIQCKNAVITEIGKSIANRIAEWNTADYHYTPAPMEKKQAMFTGDAKLELEMPLSHIYFMIVGKGNGRTAIINSSTGRTTVDFEYKSSNDITGKWTDYEYGNYIHSFIPQAIRRKTNYPFADTSSPVSTSPTDYIYLSGSFDVSGNIMSLINTCGTSDEINGEYAFYKLFAGCEDMTTAPLLPATKLSAHCYEKMFEGCKALVNAPYLPAPVLADFCYKDMFSGCINLESIKVGFNSWTPASATQNWMAGVNTIEGTFSSDNEMENKYGESYIPAKWNTQYTRVTVDLGSQPGSLGDKILAKADLIHDILQITIKGAMDYRDLELLQSMTKLKAIDLSNVTGIKTIPNAYFRKFGDLEKMVFPKTTEVIGEDACYGLENLKEIVLPEGLKEIKNYAFGGCAIEDITLPESLTTIGNEAFRYCESLKSIVIPEATLNIGSGAFGYCEKMESIKLPSKITVIPNHFMCNCLAIKALDLPDGITHIGRDAFTCPRIKELVLPSKLRTIDYGAFSLCDSIVKMTARSFVPPMLLTERIEYIFTSNTLSRERDFFVPAIALNNYQQSQWNRFYGMKPYDGDYPEEVNILNEMTLHVTDDFVKSFKPELNIIHRFEDSYYGDFWYGSLNTYGDATFSLKGFTAYYDKYNEIMNAYWDRNKYYSTLISDAKMRADKVGIDFHLPAEEWNFISFPFNVKVGDIKKGIADDDFVIRRYDSQARAEGRFRETWVNVSNDDVLQAGQGYIIWHTMSAGKESEFYDKDAYHFDAIDDSHKNDIFVCDNANVALAQYPGEYSHNSNWNFVGNPYPAYFDVSYIDSESPITVAALQWGRMVYEAYSPLDDQYILKPGQGFFVQSNNNISALTFLKEGRQHNVTPRSYNNAKRLSSVGNDRKVYNILLSNDAHSDRARVVLNEKAQLGYDMARDASKFTSESSNPFMLYSHRDNVKYAIDERPLADGKVSLGIGIPADGTYTISLDTKVAGSVSLLDKATGKATDLSTETYTFSAKSGIDDSRFQLLFAEATGVTEVINSQKAGADIIYNVAGQKVNEGYKGIVVKNGKKVVK